MSVKEKFPEKGPDMSRRSFLRGSAVAAGTVVAGGVDPTKAIAAAAPLVREVVKHITPDGLSPTWMLDIFTKLQKATHLPIYEYLKSRSLGDTFENIIKENPSRNEYGVLNISNFKKISEARTPFVSWGFEFIDFGPLKLGEYLGFELFTKVQKEDSSVMSPFSNKKPLTPEEVEAERKKLLESCGLNENNTVGDLLKLLEKLAERRYAEYIQSLHDVNLNSFNVENIDDLNEIIWESKKLYKYTTYAGYEEGGEYSYLLNDATKREKYQSEVVGAIKRLQERYNEIDRPRKEKEEKEREERRKKEEEEYNKEQEEKKKQAEERRNSFGVKVEVNAADGWENGGENSFIVLSPYDYVDETSPVAVRRFLEHLLSNGEKLKDTRIYYKEHKLNDRNKKIFIKTQDKRVIKFFKEKEFEIENDRKEFTIPKIKTSEKQKGE